jgi:hypothetical protein
LPQRYEQVNVISTKFWGLSSTRLYANNIGSRPTSKFRAVCDQLKTVVLYHFACNEVFFRNIFYFLLKSRVFLYLYNHISLSSGIFILFSLASIPSFFLPPVIPPFYLFLILFLTSQFIIPAKTKCVCKYLNGNVAMSEGCCSNIEKHMELAAKLCWLEAQFQALSRVCCCRNLR